MWRQMLADLQCMFSLRQTMIEVLAGLIIAAFGIALTLIALLPYWLAIWLLTSSANLVLGVNIVAIAVGAWALNARERARFRRRP